MSTVDGVWRLTVKGPAGPQVSVLTLATVNGALTGTQSGQGQTSTVTDAKLDGKNIFWVNHITVPMKMKVEFSGVVDEKEMHGKVKAGFMGSYPFVGIRQATG